MFEWHVCLDDLNFGNTGKGFLCEELTKISWQCFYVKFSVLHKDNTDVLGLKK